MPQSDLNHTQNIGTQSNSLNYSTHQIDLLARVLKKFLESTHQKSNCGINLPMWAQCRVECTSLGFDAVKSLNELVCRDSQRLTSLE
ncbi:unnamed protein product [Nezara viridula]|uniref:Uncharacterized protein n=1 Tax=Nezara viridula TaxID=85310 RepID=A0A9P0H689_NEZVI|nr:unnamed protein product [Nezara viridula]